MNARFNHKCSTIEGAFPKAAWIAQGRRSLGPLCTGIQRAIPQREELLFPARRQGPLTIGSVPQETVRSEFLELGDGQIGEGSEGQASPTTRLGIQPAAEGIPGDQLIICWQIRSWSHSGDEFGGGTHPLPQAVSPAARWHYGRPRIDALPRVRTGLVPATASVLPNQKLRGPSPWSMVA